MHPNAIVAEQARRVVGRLSAAVEETRYGMNLTFTMSHMFDGVFRTTGTYGSVGDLIKAINRLAETATEKGHRISFEIKPILPILHVSESADVEVC